MQTDVGLFVHTPEEHGMEAAVMMWEEYRIAAIVQATNDPGYMLLMQGKEYELLMRMTTLASGAAALARMHPVQTLPCGDSGVRAAGNST